jgi:plastocyanin
MVTTKTGKRGASRVAVGAVAIVAVAIAAFGVIYLNGSGSSACTSAASSQSSVAPLAIRISEYSGSSNSANPPGYKPDAVTVVIGVNNSVTWTNDDSAAHTATSTSAPNGSCFDSGNMGSGASYTYTFTVPGTYKYDCRYHSWMTGTIVVKAS